MVKLNSSSVAVDEKSDVKEQKNYEEIVKKKI